MFNFCEGFAGRAMVTDAVVANTCRRKCKTPWLQTRVQKLKDLSKTWVLTGKHFEVFRQKKTDTLFSTFQKHRMKHKDFKSISWLWPM